MDSKTDLTLFWLAWQKTCSIRLCCVGHESEYLAKCADDPLLHDNMQNVQGLASDVINSMNRRFNYWLGKIGEDMGSRLSYFDAEARAWKDGLGVGSAFELLESYLYAKQGINGKQFKAYLFEKVAGRECGMNRNLYGYFLKTMQTMIRKSYGENVHQPMQDEDGNDVEPKRISYDGRNDVRPASMPEQCAEVHEIEDLFKSYLAKHRVDWDSDHWLVLYCILNVIRVGGEKVQPLFEKGHQTINVLCSKMRSELLGLLKDGHSITAVAMSLNGGLQSLLDEKVRKMSWYGDIRQILEENRKSTGK